MTKKDVPVVHRLLREYLSQFSLVPVMSPDEVEHWLLPQENIIDTYLVEVKDLVLHLNNSVVFNPGVFIKVCVLLTERWQSDRFPEFLHAALYHHEPPCAPQSKSRVLLLQCAHHHPTAWPDVWCPRPGQIGAFLFNQCILVLLNVYCQ